MCLWKFGTQGEVLVLCFFSETPARTPRINSSPRPLVVHQFNCSTADTQQLCARHKSVQVRMCHFASFSSESHRSPGTNNVRPKKNVGKLQPASQADGFRTTSQATGPG